MYDDAARILAARMPNYKPPAETEGPDTISHDCFDGFNSKAEAFEDERLRSLACPFCGLETAPLKWINQGDQRYMNIYSCEQHGNFLVRAKFRKSKENGSWLANRLVYEADEDMLGFYKAKASQSRRRRSGHGQRRSRSGGKQ